jgi:dynein heavy chain
MRLNINFSSRTTSFDLQKILEDNIEKRSGRIFGPK